MATSSTVNYELRPAKNIERKMIVETLAKLSAFAAFDEYRYIGFGAIYFSDFRLVHRSLGITDMTSIEMDGRNIGRYTANKPYISIDVRSGWATQVLPKLSWDMRSIVWLDNDKLLTDDRLAEIGFVADRAESGSVLIATVLAQREATMTGAAQRFMDRVGGEPELPPGAAPTDAKIYKPWGLATYSRLAIQQRITSVLLERNKGKTGDARVRYKQLFNFHYADNAEMLTVGGIFFTEGERDRYDRAAFHTLDHFRGDHQPYKIEPPKLTLKEIRALDQQLPAPAATLSLTGVTDKELEAYQQLYRYFPGFVDADL